MFCCLTPIRQPYDGAQERFNATLPTNTPPSPWVYNSFRSPGNSNARKLLPWELFVLRSVRHPLDRGTLTWGAGAPHPMGHNPGVDKSLLLSYIVTVGPWQQLSASRREVAEKVGIAHLIAQKYRTR